MKMKTLGLGLFLSLNQLAHSAPYVLQGTILDVENQSSFKGSIVIEDGKIRDIIQGSEVLPAEYPAPVATDVLIAPGLIDNHNHIKYNFMPLWYTGKSYNNRYEWPREKAYTKGVKKIFKAMYDAPKKCEEFPRGEEKDSCLAEFKCRALIYAEMKALAGGVTTIQGSSSWSHTTADITYKGLTAYDHTESDWQSPLEQKLTDCTRGGISISERDSHEESENSVRTTAVGIDDKAFAPPMLLPSGKNASGDLVEEYLGLRTKAFFIHLSEGIDEDSAKEWGSLKKFDLARPETVVIHGTALSSQDLSEMGQKNMHLVWSPTSNLLLYGKTTPVLEAMAKGVTLSLGSDWSLSGTKSLLGELKIADKVLTRLNGGTQIEKQAAKIVAMATINAAKALQQDEKIGSLKIGKMADLVVVKRSQIENPFQDFIKASSNNVLLTLKAGKALYGDRDLVKSISGATRVSLVPKEICGRNKAFNLDYSQKVNFKSLTKTLNSQVKQAYEDLAEDIRELLELAPENSPAVLKPFSQIDPLCPYGDLRFRSMIKGL